jgi:hypothetical protein
MANQFTSLDESARWFQGEGFRVSFATDSLVIYGGSPSGGPGEIQVYKHAIGLRSEGPVWVVVLDGKGQLIEEHKFHSLSEATTFAHATLLAKLEER